jgi:hypothetical protein
MPKSQTYQSLHELHGVSVDQYRVRLETTYLSTQYSGVSIGRMECSLVTGRVS